MNNPFYNRNGVSPDMFVGRKNELEIIVSKMTSVTPCSISIVGIRRIGKTSLLQYLTSDNILRKIKNKNVLTIFFDFQKAIGITDVKFLQFLVNSIITETINYLTENKKNKLSNIDIDNEIMFLKNLRSKIWLTEDIFELGNDIFESLLERTSNKLELSLVLLFDEFEKGVYRLSSDILGFLRSLPANYRIGYIISTLKELKDVCKASETSGFYNIFEVFPLGLLDNTSCVELVRKLRETNFKVSDDEIESFLSKVGRFPYFIQLACSTIFQNVKMQGWEKHFLTTAIPVYTEIFESLDQNEKEILLTISNYNNRSENISLLQSKGLILDDGKLFSPLFSEFIQSNYTFSTISEKDLWELVSELELKLKLYIERILIAQYGTNWVENVVLKNKQNMNLLRHWIDDCKERNEDLTLDNATFGTILRIIKLPSDNKSTFKEVNNSFKQLSKYHCVNDILESIRKMRNRLNHRKVKHVDRPNANEINIISSYCKEIMLKVLNN